MTLKRFLFLLSLGVAGALIIRHGVFEGIYLKTNSMAPTLTAGDHVFVNKFTYRFRSPRRGEVVMFNTPHQTDSTKGLVKRIIALEGDTLEIKRKKVILNGQPLVELYIRIDRPDVIFVGDNISPMVIPKGHVFVMGDNRDYSGDSRDFKDAQGEWAPFVPVKSLKGAVIVPN